MKTVLFNLTLLLFLTFCAVFLFSCQRASGNGDQTTPSSVNTTDKTIDLKLTSSAFKEGEKIPGKYTADGENISPPLEWSALPKGTKSLVIICDDPDAPRGVWTHWILFNIRGDTKSLAEGVKTETTGGISGKNSSKDLGYKGPSPPPGKTHHYYFKLYALDKLLQLEEGVDKETVQKAMEGHILAKGQLIGTYER